MNNNYITLTIGKKKNIALIAHDNEKGRSDRMVRAEQGHSDTAFFVWNRNNSKNDYR